MSKILQNLLASLILAASLVVALGGGGWLFASQLAEIIEGVRSYAWPSATAVVVDSKAVHKYAAARTFRQGGQGTHVVELRYTFETNGQTYQGTRRHLDNEGKVMVAGVAEKEAKRYPVGLKLPVYYDPQDPSHSLLEKGIPIGGLLFCFFGIGLFAIGCIPIAMFIRRRQALKRWRNYR